MRRLRRRARALSVRGQLRIDGCRARRPQGRHVRRREHLQHVLLAPHLDDGRRHAARPTTSETVDLVKSHARARLGARPAQGLAVVRAAQQTTSSRPTVHPAGYNVRPLEMCGAIGLEQLKKLPGFTARRRENLRAVPTAVPGRQPLHHPARERQELVVLLHDRAQPGPAGRPREGDGRPARRRHRVSHDHRGLFPAPRRHSATSTTRSRRRSPMPTSRTTTGFSSATIRFDLTSQIEQLSRGAGQRCKRRHRPRGISMADAKSNSRDRRRRLPRLDPGAGAARRRPSRHRGRQLHVPADAVRPRLPRARVRRSCAAMPASRERSSRWCARPTSSFRSPRWSARRSATAIRPRAVRPTATPSRRWSSCCRRTSGC